MEHATDLSNVGWLAGWIVAVAVLFALGLRLPLRGRGRGARWRAFGWVAAGAVVAVVAVVALTLHDTHVDLTREKVFTPAAEALAVVDALKRPVKLAYFYRAQDPAGRRARDIVAVMARRNPLLDARVVDPDKEPTLTETAGVKLYNAAVIEADGRRVLVNTVDENEIAIGIQRVLRERVPTVCFLEGHGELPMENFEFHTHMEGLADHNHGDAASKVVEMRGHGAGRMRRALEAQGFLTQRIVTASQPAVPAACGLVVIASPRDTFLPQEADALRAWLQRGGALFAAFDLGFAPEPKLAALLADLGVALPQQVVVDPLSHYSTDPEMVAVAGYEPHPVTAPLSMTFFPGVRPLDVGTPATGLTVRPLLASSRDSFVRSVAPVDSRVVDAGAA
ncbi:MAG: GldG family protein, partial [Burkholderiales bacterium]|nr:GldG family protein [Burkholderiales bacterium]